MDCIQGELLIHRVRRCPEVEKEVLFLWLRQLIVQIDQYHRCKKNQSYRYLNPYSVLITKDERMMLLDLEAESNAFVLKNLQKRAMRKHFIKPVIYMKENTKISLDLYGYAKTVQFILSEMNVEPRLTGREERRLARVVKKCLEEDLKKQYGELKQTEKELPVYREPQKSRVRRTYLMGMVFLSVILVLAVVCKRADRNEQPGMETPVQTVREETDRAEQQEAARQEEREKTPVEEGAADGWNMMKKEVGLMEQHLLRNTVKDNQEVILKGEEIHREVVRCLAAAYDREESKERALRAYQELCGMEEKEAYLETAYIRRMELETELFREESVAVETGREAVERFPASGRLAMLYMDAVLGCGELSTEEKSVILQPLSEQFPEIGESEKYREWKTKQQETVLEEQGP